MAEAKVTVNAAALSRLGSKYRRALPDFQTELDKSQEKVGKKSVRIYAKAARSHGYKNVARGVSHSFQGKNMIITVSAFDDESGYDYADITIRGHKVKYIKPTRAKRLHFKAYGKVFFLTRVKAWSPITRWTDDALPEVQEVVHKEGVLLGKRLARKLAAK